MYISRKIFISIASSLLTGCILSVATLAYSGPGIVNVQSGHRLNVRQAENTHSHTLGALTKGAQVSVLGSNNGWFRISYKGRAGWVSGQYILVPDKDIVRIPKAKASQLPMADAAPKQDKTADKIQALIDTAKRMIGTRYISGGASASGTDCSGLTQYCYEAIGINLPHSALAQSRLGTAVSKSGLRRGDLLLFDTDGGHSNVSHVAMYIGDNQIITAQSEAKKVAVVSLSSWYWSRSYLMARRII